MTRFATTGAVLAILAVPATLALVLAGCSARPPRPSLDPGRLPAAGSARRALLVAETAASTWTDDAELIYLENDSKLSTDGASGSWGFLFYSAFADAWRNVAVRGGRVIFEGPLEFPFASAPLPRAWIDSDDAVRIAENAGGRAFRERSGADLRHAALMRGVFTPAEGPPTWAVVYRAGSQAELAIVVDAEVGTVITRFEG